MQRELEQPWYLTVVRTQGLLFIRPEKSWRPIVSVVPVNHHNTYEVVLGCDGQNPNLKDSFAMCNVDTYTQLDISVWHKSHNKSRKKRHLIGHAYISLGEIMKSQKRNGDDTDIHLSCPTPQKKSPTIGGRQQHRAALRVRLRLPSSASIASSVTAVGSSSSSASEHEHDQLSDDDGRVDDLWSQDADDIKPLDHRGGHLRRRRNVGYSIDSDKEPESASDYSYPPTPHDDCRAFMEGDASGELCMPSLLPQYADAADADGVQLSPAERLINVFAPLGELKEATEDHEYEKILGRLLTEWYVVGASLLALAGFNATIFGFAPGSLFDIDGVAKGAVVIGGTTAGFGAVSDAWFLLYYSGASGAKFKSLATDVYGSYFFFCLSCRFPTFCMFVSACALMIFLLCVAWTASPTAVLVLCFLAGTFISLQYLVFGCHRVWNLMMWSACACARTVRRILAGMTSRTAAGAVSEAPASMKTKASAQLATNPHM